MPSMPPEPMMTSGNALRISPNVGRSNGPQYCVSLNLYNKNNNNDMRANADAIIVTTNLPIYNNTTLFDFERAARQRVGETAQRLTKSVDRCRRVAGAARCVDIVQQSIQAKRKIPHRRIAIQLSRPMSNGLQITQFIQ
jgi:hypothetical protein